jgi:hypothetical protein
MDILVAYSFFLIPNPHIRVIIAFCRFGIQICRFGKVRPAIGTNVPKFTDLTNIDLVFFDAPVGFKAFCL